MSSFGEFIGAVILGILIRWFYAKHLMLAHLCVCVVGGVFYGVGKFGWMLLIGQLMITVSPIVSIGRMCDAMYTCVISALCACLF